MEQNKQLSLQFASISGKKVTADFTGGDVTSLVTDFRLKPILQANPQLLVLKIP